MVKKLLYFLLLLSATGCFRSDCSKLPSAFHSYAEAKKAIHSSRFTFSDKITTGKSSWIRSARYMSCDGNTGYLELDTDDENYIHQDVPIEVWDDFKNAESLGGYYNQYIKHRYQLQLDR